MAYGTSILFLYGLSFLTYYKKMPSYFRVRESAVSVMSGTLPLKFDLNFSFSDEIITLGYRQSESFYSRGESAKPYLVKTGVSKYYGFLAN